MKPGGMAIITNNGQGNAPTVTWSSTGHTGVEVDIFAWGVNAENFQQVVDNTDVHQFLLQETPTGVENWNAYR